LHLDEAASARAAEAAGVGSAAHAGVLQVLCRTPDDFLGINVEPAYAAAIYEDEQQFTNPAGMLGAFLELHD
ncbi:MAG: EthD domain-containing protein, partial [Candidatus Binatia bacterium]